MSNTERFPRLCDIKKVGIYTGFVFYDGLFTCEDEDDALKYAMADGYSSLDEAYEDEAYYYTEWEECDDTWFEEINGVWYECTEDSREIVK